MTNRLYFKPSINLSEDRRNWLEKHSRLLEIVLFYISYKEMHRSEKGTPKFIDKKQFGGKVVKQAYENYVISILNKVRKGSRNSLSKSEAEGIIGVLKDALNIQGNDQSMEGNELIDYIYYLTDQYIKLHKSEIEMKRLLNSGNNTIINKETLNSKIETKEEISQQYYWLNVDSTYYEWSFSDIKVGRSQTYSNLNPNGNKRKNERCFTEIQIGDLAVAYETGNLKAITTICEVTEKYIEDNEIFVEFQKIRDFENPLELNVMEESEDLQDCEVVYFHRGTLFELESIHFETITNLLNEKNAEVNEGELYDAVKRSIQDESVMRKQRLKNRNSLIPITYETTTKMFQRNPDVIAEILIRANGICEKCNKKAPFYRASDGTPYLEVHHLIRLADGGEDTVDNAIAVCPNCHRELHFGL